ncbi:ADP-ribose pyrophosphatase, mitochondrial isoform X2 [Adelges cooleyi]|nr:ADP-ribose pyrophosphatase, mitochondrial isoform X2 [Adelges cooleyi]XP_050437217.1 ADP-ribose pyrophosphatase, mitochondrial isoform X2 [Adelges cooleyi]XP_050437218.1 ADP-ribose pyrophosphatase, mitochondrial isoform X2 [Adelges cooleyi]
MKTMAKQFLHVKCRNSAYPGTDGQIIRAFVPDHQVCWTTFFPLYNPVTYTSPSVIGKPWADFHLDAINFKPIWNIIDGKINRVSYSGQYKIQNGYPLNPYGRTGIKGRGVLGRWGPNHAADPIVTRWKKIHSQQILHTDTGQPVLQFIAIQRKDSREWAIPGGMVDSGEVITSTLKREFMEEALNSLEKTEENIAKAKSEIEDIFKNGVEVYRGYVDDPRNTDNSWMETVAMHFHDEKGDHVGKLNLHAGDDAIGVKWIDLNRNLKLFASHISYLELVALRLNCHW